MSHQDRPPSPTADDDSSLLIVRFDEIHEPTASPTTGKDSGTVPLLTDAAGRGLARANAVLALESLRGGQVAVERIQVVRALDESPEYVLQEWRCETGIGESTDAWVRRSVHLAERFVDEWPDPGDGTVRYLLITSGPTEITAAA